MAAPPSAPTVGQAAARRASAWLLLEVTTFHLLHTNSASGVSGPATAMKPGFKL